LGSDKVDDDADVEGTPVVEGGEINWFEGRLSASVKAICEFDAGRAARAGGYSLAFVVVEGPTGGERGGCENEGNERE